MNRQSGFLDASVFRAFFWFLFLAGLAVGAILFVVIPWLWRLAKPWIHSVTG